MTLTGEIAMFAGLLIFGGIIAGVLSGLFGVGGGGIIVPVLYELFGAMETPEDVRMHLAVGTCFAIIIPTSFRAARAHYERGAVDSTVLPTLAIGALVGVLLGSVTAKYADDSVMKIIWVVSASIMSMTFFFKRESWRLAGRIESPAILLPVGTVISFLATLMGVGGAAQLSTVLALYGRTIHVAVGTASAFSAIIAIPATLGFVWAGWSAEGLPPGSVGYVSLIGAAAMIPASVLAAPFGVRMAHGLSRRKLEIAFGCFLLTVGCRFLLALVF